LYQMTTRPTEKFGLLFEFSLEPTYNDNIEACAASPERTPIGGDFSLNNKNVCWPFIKPWMKNVVEIGVSRDSWEDSSTKFLLDNLAEDAKYTGIDIGDRKFVEEKDPRARIIVGDSQNVEDNLKEILKNGEYIDLFLIDGHHGVNAVLREWDYAPYVRPNGGTIILHDTTYHSGPWCLSRAVDPKFFDIHILSQEDLGVTIFVRK
jgi:hypothetical protein